MLEYGLTTLVKTGRPVMVIADGDFRGMKSGGITLDLAVIPTGTGQTLTDDTVVPTGVPFLRYGQIMTKETTAAVQTITFAGTVSGGTYTLTYNGQSAVLAYNATAAQVAAAINALSTVASISPTVTTTGGPGPTNIVATFPPALGATLMTVVDNTTGAGHSVTIGNTTPGIATGAKFGPYDSAATDGRQTLTRGECFILNRTWIDNALGFGLGQATSHPAVFDTGRVWKSRLIQAGAGAASLAAGPTLAAFLTAFPGISFVQE